MNRQDCEHFINDLEKRGYEVNRNDVTDLAVLTAFKRTQTGHTRVYFTGNKQGGFEASVRKVVYDPFQIVTNNVKVLSKAIEDCESLDVLILDRIQLNNLYVALDVYLEESCLSQTELDSIKEVVDKLKIIKGVQK